MTDTGASDVEPRSAGLGRGAAAGLLIVIAGVAALAYAWGLYRDPLEPYYAAAVKSMATSWRDFAYGAFDPAGTITLDKLPGAFWVQALVARAVGVHAWSLVLPQVVEGVLTVLVLYRAVHRAAGRSAGLVAALVLAVSPAVVALDRGNISDTVMILLLVLAADAISAAVVGSAGVGRLLLAGLWVGLAFQAKMLEAWLVLPALAIPYLAAGPGGLGGRVRNTVLGGVAAGVVSLAWMVAVTLVPASSRPYVDGSTHDSLFEQVFVYNGLGRIGATTPLQILAGQGLGVSSGTSPPGALRLLSGGLGRDCGWLLLAASIVAVAGIISARHRPRTDPLRAAYLLWGLWLVIFAAAFSVATQINSYYTAALVPPVAALLGVGIVDARRRAGRGAALVAAGVVVVTALSAAVLPGGSTAPAWLVPVAVAVAVLAVGMLIAAALRPTSGRLLVGGLVAAAAAALVAPVVTSGSLVVRGQGALDVPFEAGAEAAGIDELFVVTPARIASTLPSLRRAQAGAPDLLAVQSAAVASVFQLPSRDEVLPIGGFTGTGPTPTLDQLRAAVAAGTFHLVLTFSGDDPRVAWIAAHCRSLDQAPPPFREFYCTPANAR